MRFATRITKILLFPSCTSAGNDIRHQPDFWNNVTMDSGDDEPNPPIWPDSVTIVRETDDPDMVRKKLEVAAQDVWNEEHQTFTSDHHFSNRRHAVLFAPGSYNYSFQVGYYTQVAGLGRSADDVKFVSGTGPFVTALNQHLHADGTCLDTFWRSAENFFVQGSMTWAVSQASPLRRVHIGGDLVLHDRAAYASGGHLANARIDGHLYAGGQQQYFVKNVELTGGASGGAWSMVYVGCTGMVPSASPGSGTSASITVVDTPHVRQEKPYIALKEDGIAFELRIPTVLRTDSDLVGPLLEGTQDQVIDFSRVRLVQPTDATEDIQAALDNGKDVVLSPGIYELKEPLKLSKSNQVLLGMGLATLVGPPHGPCVQIQAGTTGCILAGIMLEASKSSEDKDNKILLEVGEAGSMDPGNHKSPVALFDIYCRVGGSSHENREAIAVDTMARIHSGHVIGENLWLWRADHAQLGDDSPNYPHISPIFWQTEQHQYRVETGLEVFGDDVTMFGLAVEHANGHQTVWSGNRGLVYFYQCEFPYGVDCEFASSGFRGYLVKETVKEHTVFAPGIYSNFRNENVVVPTAIEHPERPGVVCVNPFTVKLDNQGAIASVTNGKGIATAATGIPIRLTS